MFDNIIGNEHVKDVLRRHLALGRVPNALLFAGIEGIGKRLFALELARAFLCRSKKGDEACGGCPACTRAGQFEFPKDDDKDAHKKVIFSNHADVGTVIPYNRNILVDAIRDLEKEANFRPYEGNARFFLVDDADKMNDAAANALLKTLEEPPAATHIILITSRPDTLLPTIRSRCQVVRFAPVAAGQIEKFLIRERKLSPADAKLTGRLAFGSVGRALSIELDKLRAQRKPLIRILHDAIETHDRISLLQSAERQNDAKNKDNFEENLELLLTLIRDVWTLGLGGREEKVVNVDLTPELARLADKGDANRLAQWIDEIEELRGTLVVNINKKMATDSLFLKMAAK